MKRFDGGDKVVDNASKEGLLLEPVMEMLEAWRARMAAQRCVIAAYGRPYCEMPP